MIKLKIMQTKQTIAIIGATGNMGSAIARSIAKGPYRLLLKASKQDELDALVTIFKAKTLVLKLNRPYVPQRPAGKLISLSWLCHMRLKKILLRRSKM
jgi:3-hydroxyacyl-CoA dehydrogenase